MACKRASKQFGLTRHDGRQFRLACPRQNFIWKSYDRCPVALRLKPGALGKGLIQKAINNGKLGFCFRVVEDYQSLAIFNPVTIFHPDFTDNATFLVLNLLRIGFNHDRGRRNDSAIQFGKN